MSQDLHKGMFDKGKGFSEEDILAYLDGNVSEEKRRVIEEALTEEGMASDAMDGLEQIPVSEARSTVDQINAQLKRQILSRQKRNRRNYFKDGKWSWIATLIILILLVVSFLLIRMALHKD